MTGFTLKSNDNVLIRFRFYKDDAPLTVESFSKLLPFSITFYHARVSGQEFWAADAIQLDILQENASVFTEPGEIVLGPSKPSRVKTANAIGIYYGEGKGLDAANIFGKVVEEDLPKLKELGEKIWKHGQQELTFQKTD